MNVTLICDALRTKLLDCNQEPYILFYFHLRIEPKAQISQSNLLSFCTGGRMFLCSWNNQKHKREISHYVADRNKIALLHIQLNNMGNDNQMDASRNYNTTNICICCIISHNLRHLKSRSILSLHFKYAFKKKQCIIKALITKNVKQTFSMFVSPTVYLMTKRTPIETL